MPALTFSTPDGGLAPVVYSDFPKLRRYADMTPAEQKIAPLSLASTAQPTPHQLVAIIDLVRVRTGGVSWMEQLLFNRREVQIKLTGESVAKGLIFDLRYIPGAGWYQGSDGTSPFQTIDEAEEAGVDAEFTREYPDVAEAARIVRANRAPLAASLKNRDVGKPD